MRREQIANDTLHILGKGEYQSPSGRRVDLGSCLLDCVKNTECYEPEALVQIRERVLAQPAQFTETVYEVENETTLQGSARLAASYESGRIGVLNFASAKHPGGGFLTGAQAQEESLARSSGLYHSLLQCQSFYNFHLAQRSGLYTDRMIYSPRCPVFRRDDGSLLEQVYQVDFITSPAPNARAIYQNEQNVVKRIEGAIRERASKILSLAIHHGCDLLVLGAWGCGVFGNDPALVARIFQDLLGPDQLYWKRFRKVVFSVRDTSRGAGTFHAFHHRLVWRPGENCG